MSKITSITSSSSSFLSTSSSGVSPGLESTVRPDQFFVYIGSHCYTARLLVRGQAVPIDQVSSHQLSKTMKKIFQQSSSLQDLKGVQNIRFNFSQRTGASAPAVRDIVYRKDGITSLQRISRDRLEEIAGDLQQIGRQAGAIIRASAPSSARAFKRSSRLPAVVPVPVSTATTTSVRPSTQTSHDSTKKRNLSQIFKAKENQVVAIRNGIPFRLKKVEENPADRAGGQNLQIKAVLTDPSGKEYKVRIKETKFNEAAIYHKMRSKNDSLSSYLPDFYCAYDVNGDPMDSRALHDDNLHSKKMYLMLGDVAGKQVVGVDDFKFCKTEVLLRNPLEIKKHKQTKHSKMANWLTHKALRASRFPFALAASAGGILGRAKRGYNFTRTKSVMEARFKSLSRARFKETIADLHKLKKAFEKSHFAFSDASLLFVSTLENGEPRLKIYLIDLLHAIRDDEGIQNFKQVKKDAVSSLDELIAFANNCKKSA